MPQSVSKLRSSAPWDDESLIRAPRFSYEQLARHARSLADSHVVMPHTRPVISPIARTKQNSRVLAANYDAIMDSVTANEPISPAAEWYIDNFHAIEKQVQLIRRDLPHGYLKVLPKLGPGFLEGHPRIFGVMWAYVAHTDSLLDPEELSRYIQAYSTRHALEIGELWAVAINLRILLVENARRLSTRIMEAGRERLKADQLADALLGIGRPSRPTLAEAMPGWRTTSPSIPFAVQLLRRLSESPARDALQWVHTALGERGHSSESAVQHELSKQSQGTLTMRNIVTSMRLLDDVNWEKWIESVSAVEQELRRATGHKDLDFATRNRYRSTIERLARGSGQDELAITRRALRFAAEGSGGVSQDVGYWLVDAGVPLLEQSINYRPKLRERLVRMAQGAGTGGYVGAVVLLTALLTGLATWVIASAWAGLDLGPSLLLGALAALPISDFVAARLGTRLTRLIPTEPLPALHLEAGVPEEFRTLVVVPTMITSPDAVTETLETLETHFLANDNGEIYFAAATDWADADVQESAEDLELLASMRHGVEELNATYGARFLLFHRERRFNPSEGVWMGWERKRGKLAELGQVLRGATDTSITTIEGHLPGPFTYVLTLDADTRLPRVAAKNLVGKIAHPLNAARFGSEDGRVVRGYTILQPRVTPSLPTSEVTSIFQMLYTTRQGLDPYAFAVADVYQDVFEEGSFTGKGIYDIAALERSLADRIPDNAVLSHDLLEGNYSRSGFVSDVEVVEEHPTSYGVHLSRSHRWTRGDWQLLPWIVGSRRKEMTGLGIWKMVDNLRRSLSPIAFVLATIAGTALLPPDALGAWIILLVATFLLPLLMPALRGMLSFQDGVSKRSQLAATGKDLEQSFSVGLLDFTLMGHQASAMVDAIVRTLWRMTVSHAKLLEWTTAAAAGSTTKGTLGWFTRTMNGGFAAPVLLLAAASWRGPAILAVVAPVITLWLAAPVAAWWISRPLDPVQRQASPDVARGLRAIARRTWRFFEVFVTAADSDLPPDNFQEDPTARLAHRTSPTNIGMYYLSTVAARDLGWIGLTDATDRLYATMRTQVSLDHHRGHLFNWYDTTTTHVMEPRYISAVDSGNLAGHLIALANACADLVTHDPLGDDVRTGIEDALDCVAETATGADLDLTAAREAVRAVRPGTDGERPGWEQVLAVVADLTAPLPATDDATDWLRATAASVRSRLRDLSRSPEEMATTRVRLAWVEAEARREFDAMDFRLVLDRERELLSVGYRVDEDELDDATYDMLASECRLASFVAIAKGDIRTKHWSRLARGLTALKGGAALLSWSGSMFEYLMPALVMRAPATGLLATTMERVVHRQIEYGAEHSIPWGISESAYNSRDRELNYQYSPFGVPGLGIVRGLADNLVIAPYATGLAAQVDPDDALANYRRLAELGARGRYGFFEAVDFTSERLPRHQDHAVVRNYMAHHSGMTIVAIHNVLTQGAMREWFHSEPMVRATELLLHEAAPRVAPVVHARTDELDPRRERQVRAVVPPSVRRLTGDQLARRTVAVLSNGRLSLTATPSGATHLRWNGLAITRWHTDLTTDESGSALFVRDNARGRVHTPTEYPLFTGHGTASATLSEDAIQFVRTERRVTTTLEHHISPEADAYVQALTVRNLSPEPLDLDVVSVAELALGRKSDDDAHPAFSKMFVRTHEAGGVLYATRRRRSSSDPEVWLAQFITASEDASCVGPDPDHPIGIETDGRKLIGRGRCLRDPAILDKGATPSGTTGYVMEPVLSLTVRLHVPASGRGQVRLWTVLGASEDEVAQLVDSHRASGAYERLVALAFTTSQGQLRHLSITPAEAAHFQTLAGNILFPDLAMRAGEEALNAGGSQADLWALGISGDLPILVVRIDDEADIDLPRQAMRAFEYWRLRRLAVDLVFLCEDGGGYVAQLQRRLSDIAASIHSRTGSPDSNGRVFVVRRDLAPASAVDAMLAAAAVVLVAKRGGLTDQLVASPAGSLPKLTRPAAVPATAPPALPAGLTLPNGYGGYGARGTEYVIVTDAAHPTPAPWTNVVANERFGFHATAEGAGYTWWLNSRDNQVTPWRNAPIRTPVSEVLYARDSATGSLVSLGSAPVPGGTHTTRHGFGYTTYETSLDGVALQQTMFVPLSGDVKYSIVTLHNRTGKARSVRLVWYAEPVLGSSLETSARHLVTSRDRTGALVVANPWSPQHPGQVAFADMRGEQDSFTGDRSEFLGRHGTLAAPAALTGKARLSGRVGPGLDPCLALGREVTLPPGARANVVITLGAAASREEVGPLVEQFRAADPVAELAAVRAHWAATLGKVKVSTPDPSFDAVMNGWLLYQTVACRMTARSGYYQASGAFGFRDQLQDSMTAVLVEPAAARHHLLVAAGRQFLEGDVQHWWLPATGDGIRTRITDDVVWLAYVTAHYLRVTGDLGVLDEEVPFLEGEVLAEGEDERYFHPETSSQTATLYEHCVIGLRHAMRYGFHGLPLIGTGDWNDGMNRVGREGRGESVWLGWFLVAALRDFRPIALARRDEALVLEFDAESERLITALEAEGWDGEWYRRGYFDDGTPLGAACRSECRIDTIAQSWAVLSGAADPERARMAMEAVERELVVPSDRILRLFTPPFDTSEPDPGYIRAYPPGVRENGGQYTHGALWSIFAWRELGRVDRAAELFSLINPVNHSRDRAEAERYAVEPYVVAADVYSVAPMNGKGGWTWYTGSAGWMYRAGLEAILGVRVRSEHLEIDPQLPPGWDRAEVTVRADGGDVVVVLQRGETFPGSGRQLMLDGELVALATGAPACVPLTEGALRAEVWDGHVPQPIRAESVG